MEDVVPTFRFYGWAVFGDHSQAADMVSAKADNASLRQRILAGRFFDTSEERSAMVSEFLLYQLGVTDDEAMNSVMGKKLRLEFRAEQYGAGLGLYLVKPGGEVTQEEMAALDEYL